jgi:xanthine dehydrogenase accessory factor
MSDHAPESPSPPALEAPPSVCGAPTFYEQLVALEREGTAFVLVVLVESLGSTPQDPGAKMLVTSAGRQIGTVGGGRVEAQAIALAQEMLAGGAAQPRFVNWTLKGDVGMTCGGSVKFYLEPHAGAGGAWPIAIFGAGHVAQALLPVLLPLPCTLTVCDSRAEWLEQLPRARNLRAVAHDNPADLIPSLPDRTFLLCMTKGHASDLPVLRRALTEREFPFIGVIGSAAKASVLRRELVAAGIAPERAATFHCPLGLEFGTNHPHEIALSIAGQLLTERDRLHGAQPRQDAAPV